jgi:hypothetical protein
MDDVEKLKSKLKEVQKRSSARKRHLRDMNEKLKMYQAIADAAISDAARWKRESDYWKLVAETQLGRGTSENKD